MIRCRSTQLCNRVLASHHLFFTTRHWYIKGIAMQQVSIQGHWCRGLLPSTRPNGTKPRHSVIARVAARPPLTGINTKKLGGSSVVLLGAQHRHTIPVTVSHQVAPGTTFVNYMDSLTHDFSVLQIPLGASLKRLSALEYELQVPKMQVLDLWLQPLSKANVVERQPGGVALSCTSAQLHGSPQIRQLRLDQAFNLLVQVSLKWQPHGELQPGSKALIHVEASIDVDVDTPFPFNMMPKPALQLAGNTALSSTLQLMLQGFGGSLASDYHAWAASSELRASRAAAIAGDTAELP